MVCVNFISIKMGENMADPRFRNSTQYIKKHLFILKNMLRKRKWANKLKRRLKEIWLGYGNHLTKLFLYPSLLLSCNQQNHLSKREILKAVYSYYAYQKDKAIENTLKRCAICQNSLQTTPKIRTGSSP